MSIALGQVVLSRWICGTALALLLSGCKGDFVKAVDCGSNAECGEGRVCVAYTCVADEGGGSDITLIDDFEAPNNQVELPGGGLWYTFGDETGQQTPAPTAPVLPVPGNTGGLTGAVTVTSGGTSRGWLHTFGSGFTDWGAGVGANLNEPPAPYDARTYTGVRFTYASSVPLLFEVATSATTAVANGGSCTVDCFGHYSVPLPASTEPKTFEVAWDQLYQVFGATTVFEPEQIIDVQWNFAANDPFDFWLDDVAFVRAPAGDGGLVDTTPPPAPIVVDDFDDLDPLPHDPRFLVWTHYSEQGALDHRPGSELGIYSWVDHNGRNSVGAMELEWNLEDVPDGRQDYPGGGLLTYVSGYIDLSRYTRFTMSHRYEHTGDCESITGFSVLLSCGDETPTSFAVTMPVSSEWQTSDVKFSSFHESLPVTAIPMAECLKRTTLLNFYFQSPRADGACSTGHLFLDGIGFQ